MFRRHHIFTFSILAWVMLPLHAADQRWIRVSSDRFIVLTDSNEKAAHEIAVRFEQMRAVFGDLLSRSKPRMSQPMEITAFSNNNDYVQLAPPQTAHAGFWLPGEDRVFIVLNLSQPDSWRAVEYQFARYMLNYNYPPTPPWFDEGFAQYFSSLYFTPKNTELGSDPAFNPAHQNQAGSVKTKSFAQVLTDSAWLPWPELLATKNLDAIPAERRELFNAQSWILLHYLLKQDKMPQLGQYFGLVEMQKIPVDQAIQQAFGINTAELDRELKDYFHSLLPKLGAPVSRSPNAPPVPPPVNQSALPFSLEDIGTSSKSVPLPEAQALVDEMELRVPERRQAAFDHLQKLVDDEKTETVIAHRALAWAYVQKGETNHAFEELREAVRLSPNDPWTRFGLAQASYHSGQQGARVQGLANMMESLHIVIGEFPDFAEAYNMLAWARLAGGGANAAVESAKYAVQLAPRDEQYQLLLAKSYLAAKKFNNATPILDRLKLSQDAVIAKTASKDLTDLPFLEKYGIPPEEAKAQQEEAKKQVSGDTDDEDSEEQEPAAKPTSTTPPVDKRPVKFLKGTLLSVDCSKPPMAMLSLSQGNRTFKLRAADYKSVAVIGAPEFSCDWKAMPVNVNYRASGVLSGDLVSIEVH